MSGEHDPFTHEDDVERELWITLRAMIRDFEPDPAMIRHRMENPPASSTSTPGVIEVRPQRRQAPARRRPAGARTRLPALGAAAAVVIVAGGVLLSAHTGLGRGGRQDPGGGNSSPTSLSTISQAAPPPVTPSAAQTGPARSGTPSPAASRIAGAEHTVVSSAGRTSRPTARTSKPSSLMLSVTGVLRGAQSGKCVTVPDGSKANGTVTVLAPCGTSADQRWTFTPSHELQIYGATKCLAVAGQSTSDYAAAEIWDCNGGGNQHWTMRADGTLLAVQSGRCLDATDHSKNTGTRLQIYTCSVSSNQRWNLGPLGGVP